MKENLLKLELEKARHPITYEIRRDKVASDIFASSDIAKAVIGKKGYYVS